MTTTTHQTLVDGSFTDASAGSIAHNTDYVTWYRIPFAIETDNLSTGIRIGVCRSLTIHLGTVAEDLATTAAVIEVQAGNPDGTWNDIGTQFTVATGASPALDTITVFDPPELIRLSRTSADPTAGDFDILLEVHRTRY